MLFSIELLQFYFDVIQAHTGVLDLGNMDALRALEQLTHATESRPNPVMSLSNAVQEDIPAMFRRAAINAALGSARSFYGNLERYRRRKEKAEAKAARKGKKARQFKDRPPVPPRTWNKSAVLYAGMHKETNGLVHLHQALDWHVLELGACRPHRPQHSRGFRCW